VRFYFPIFTLILCVLVLCVSSLIAYEVHGSIFSKVKILELREYGGVTFQQLGQLEIWRLVSSQFVHVKPIHMLFNVISLFFIGYFVEKQIGGKNLVLLFWVSGIIGTLASIVFIPEPYDVGTGASQAVLGLTACGLLLMVKGINKSIWLKLTLIFCIVPAMALDIIYSGFPKLGHIIGFVVGLIISLYCLPKAKISNYQEVNS
jgi:membrane associated rhomboid family serine protease